MRATLRPINQIGLYGTGLAISSNPVTITTPGTASSYMWYSAPGYSQYFVPVSLLNGTVGSTVRLPYVPNSMVMDRTGNNLYFGSSHELMIFSTTGNVLTKQDPSVPGVVLAVAPNDSLVLINDQVRNVFYLYNPNGTIASTFGGANCSPGTVCGGLGASAQWTPDSKTLYITDSAALGGNHTDTLYVYNANTGWTTYNLPSSSGSKGAQSLAIMVPSVGAYVSGNPTVAHTWCPAGNVGAYNSMVFYPQEPSVAGDSVNVQTDVLAATNDGHHILGAAQAGSGITLLRHWRDCPQRRQWFGQLPACQRRSGRSGRRKSAQALAAFIHRRTGPGQRERHVGESDCDFAGGRHRGNERFRQQPELYYLQRDDAAAPPCRTTRRPRDLRRASDISATSTSAEAGPPALRRRSPEPSAPTTLCSSSPLRATT